MNIIIITAIIILFVRYVILRTKPRIETKPKTLRRGIRYLIAHFLLYISGSMINYFARENPNISSQSEEFFGLFVIFFVLIFLFIAIFIVILPNKRMILPMKIWRYIVLLHAWLTITNL